MRYNIYTGVQNQQLSIKKLVIAGVAALGLLSAAAVPVLAAGKNTGTTTGDCISDGFYGNEPNMANGAPGGPAEQTPGTQAGNVLPSQSPGPFVTDPNTGEVTKGNSIAYYNDLFGPGAIPKYCHSNPSGL